MEILKSEGYCPSENHTFGIFTLDHQDEGIFHGHDFEEIIIVKEGCGFHIINNEVSFICKGDVFVVRTTDFHSYRFINNLSLINIVVRKDREFHFLNNIDKALDIIEKSYVSLSEEELNDIVSICNYINVQFDSDYDERHFFDIESNLTKIFNIMLLASQHDKENISYNGKKELIRKIKKIYKRNIEWERLCIESGVSKRSMFRFIKNLTGLTPVKFINLYRLLKSRELLKTTDMKVYEVSEYCGFSSSNHFCEQYKQTFKKNPTQEKNNY